MIRVFHDISQVKLADRLEISKSHLSEIESGKKIVTLALLADYSKIFNIPISSLILFSERLASNSLSEKKRIFVARKIIRLMEWMVEKENLEND